MLDPAWVALSLSKRLGSKTLAALMRHFDDDTRAILAADEPMLRQVPGVGPKIAQAILAIDLDTIQQEMAAWLEAGVKILTPEDPEYPPRLRPLEDRPPTLFVRGKWCAHPRRTVALVGTRSPSPQAVDAAQKCGYELARQGWTVVSGLALGIDQAGLSGALAWTEGDVQAVLGSGVLNVYPPQNAELAQSITQRGALLCEVHPQASVNTPALVARNRIISGLSDVLIVVESEVDGGAMYAARFAQEQGRPIFALDLPASGNRALIENGARALAPDLRDWEWLGEQSR